MTWTQHDKPGMSADSGWSDSRESRQRVGATHWSAVRTVRRSASLATSIIFCFLIPQSARSQAEPLPEQLTRHTILDYVRDNDVTSVEDFIAVLPDMHLNRNVFVFESGALVGEFVSGERPRVVSWGADGRFVLSWGTNPDSPFYQAVEFLEAARDRWVAGVIDFSGDRAEIREPEVCSTCHGHLNKPLWGQFTMWRGTEGGEGNIKAPEIGRLVRRAHESEDPRLSQLRTEHTQRVTGGGISRGVIFRDEATNELRELSSVAREAGSVFAWRHAEVVFGRIAGRDDYAAIARGMVCGDPSSFGEAVPLRDHHLSVLNNSGELLPGNSLLDVVFPSYWNGYGNLYDSVRFLVLHDLFRRDTRVSRALAGHEDMLSLVHRQHFSGVGRASLWARLRGPDGAVRSGGTMRELAESLGPLACAALRDQGGGLTGRAGHDVFVAGFTLVDATGDRILGSVREGDEIIVHVSAASEYTFRADVAVPEHVGSVQFAITGAAGAMRREALDASPPYVLHGDDGAGDYLGESLPPGEYYLSATPYSTADADGQTEAGVISTARFVVYDSAAAPQIVSIGTGPATVLEGSSLVFTLTRTGTAADPLTVAVSLAETGSALVDFPPTSVTFAPGDTTATLSVPTKADNVVVGTDSTVTARVIPGTGYAVGGASLALVTVEDDDTAKFALSWDPESIAEGESATLVVAIANGVTFAEDQTFRLSWAGTASPADYTGLPSALTLEAGASAATAEVTATDDREEEEAETLAVAGWHAGPIGTATLTITAVSHDARLSALSLSGIDIGTFSGDTTTYAATVGHPTSSTTVTATATHPRASVSIQPGAAVSLAEGANVIAVTVVAEDGTTTKTYTVTVTRAAAPLSEDAALRTLSLSGADIGAFSPDSTAYAASVAHEVASTTVTAAASHSAAKVTIAPGSEVSLAVGANEIAVTVTAEDGTTTRTYTVTVTRAEEPALPVVSIAAVEERLVGPIGEFRVSRTGPTAEALEVQVLFTNSRSSRTQTLTIRLLPGRSSVTRRVQAGDNRLVEDDITVTYTLREGEGYTVSAERGSASVVLEESDIPEFSVSARPAEIAESESAAVRVAITNGVRFREAQTIDLSVSGTASGADYAGVPETLRLRAYKTETTTATLTAAVDGEEEAEETVTITASHGGVSIGSATLTIASVSHDASLRTLSLSGVDIGAFSPDSTAYAASVAHEVTSTTVTAAASHSAATVSIEPGSEVSLAVGENEIAVTVTAEDGSTTRSYRVTVTRAEEPALPVVSVAAVEERLVGPIGEFRVSRTGPTAEALEVQVLFTNSRSSRTQTLTIRLLPGRSSVTRRVQAGDNRLVEDDITVTYTLREGEGYTVSAERGSASVVLEESDIPEFSVSARPAEIAEGESAAVRVAIANGVRFREAQTIDLSVSGTASGSDYRGVPQTLRLRAYKTSTTTRLTAAVDGEEEAEETVTITASHGGSEIGSATVTIAGAETPLTGRLVEMPEAHDGETAFAFELRFSEEIRISYKTLRDTAFEVKEGVVRGARRLERPSNRRWEITVEPTSDGDIELALPVTKDCAAEGAVCTAAGKRLSQQLTATVPGPGTQASVQGFSLAPDNGRPSGIWSDGATAWVADLDDGKLFAYRLSDGERAPERDVGVGGSPMGLWSDGATLWVAELTGGLAAYRLSDGERLDGSGPGASGERVAGGGVVGRGDGVDCGVAGGHRARLPAVGRGAGAGPGHPAGGGESAADGSVVGRGDAVGGGLGRADGCLPVVGRGAGAGAGRGGGGTRRGPFGPVVGRGDAAGDGLGGRRGPRPRVAGRHGGRGGGSAGRGRGRLGRGRAGDWGCGSPGRDRGGGRRGACRAGSAGRAPRRDPVPGGAGGRGQSEGTRPRLQPAGRHRSAREAAVAPVPEPGRGGAGPQRALVADRPGTAVAAAQRRLRPEPAGRVGSAQGAGRGRQPHRGLVRAGGAGRSKGTAGGSQPHRGSVAAGVTVPSGGGGPGAEPHPRPAGAGGAGTAPDVAAGRQWPLGARSPGRAGGPTGTRTRRQRRQGPGCAVGSGRAAAARSSRQPRERPQPAVGASVAGLGACRGERDREPLAPGRRSGTDPGRG